MEVLVIHSRSSGTKDLKMSWHGVAGLKTARILDISGLKRQLEDTEDLDLRI